MKFLMSIAVCSFVEMTCTPWVHYPKSFDSWNLCMREAYKESLIIIEKIDVDVIEKNRLATKFACSPLNGA